MNKINDHYQIHREWEILDDEVITHLTFENALYNLPKDCIITFKRDNQFDLRATISGIVENKEDFERNESNIAGTFLSKENIIAFSNNGVYQYKLNGIAIRKVTSSLLSIEKPAVKFDAELHIDSIEKSHYNYDPAIHVIQEWCLSGKSNLNFSRTTKRSVNKTYQKIRETIDTTDNLKTTKSNGSSSDFLFVQTPEFNFIISQVPSECGPDWSFNLCIEYRQSFIRLPNKEERDAVREFVSFIFGTQLLDIGISNYDESFNLVSQTFNHPWGDNVVSKCQKSGLPPVNIGNYQDWGRAEILLTELFPEYLKQRKPQQLKGLLWKYWLARDSAIGTNLPILSSSLENLAEQLLKNHPEKKAHYIEYHEFNSLIKVELEVIKNKLEKFSFSDKILNKIKAASQRGSNEKFDMMFEIIKLNVGDIERKAIKSRNKMAHSTFDIITDKEAIEVIQLTRAYETLFHRVLLKLLGYNGNYIDYYSYGHPSRHIDECIPN